MEFNAEMSQWPKTTEQSCQTTRQTHNNNNLRFSGRAQPCSSTLPRRCQVSCDQNERFVSAGTEKRQNDVVIFNKNNFLKGKKEHLATVQVYAILVSIYLWFSMLALVFIPFNLPVH